MASLFTSKDGTDVKWAVLELTGRYRSGRISLILDETQEQPGMRRRVHLPAESKMRDRLASDLVWSHQPESRHQTSALVSTDNQQVSGGSSPRSHTGCRGKGVRGLRIKKRIKRNEGGTTRAVKASDGKRSAMERKVSGQVDARRPLRSATASLNGCFSARCHEEWQRFLSSAAGTVQMRNSSSSVD